MRIFIFLFFIINLTNSSAQSMKTLSSVDSSPATGIVDWASGLLDEPSHFGYRSTVLQLGLGFASNVNLKEQALLLDGWDAKLLSPAVNLTFEKNVWNNLGVGITLANQNWQVPEFGYRYLYFSGGLRASYHLNTIDNLDTYLGIIATYSRMHLTNGSFNTFNHTVTASWIFGARYYFKERTGVFLEIGDDGLSYLKTGLSFYFF